jgi:hypothetical protein
LAEELMMWCVVVVRGHKQYVTSLAWEPMHLNKGSCERLASSSKARGTTHDRQLLMSMGERRA